MTNPPIPPEAPEEAPLPPDPQGSQDPQLPPDPNPVHELQAPQDQAPVARQTPEPQADPIQSQGTISSVPESVPEPQASPNPTSQSAPEQAPVPQHAPTLWSALGKATGYNKDLTPEQQITRRSFVSFSAFALLGVAAWKSWFWIKDAVQSDGVQTPLRKGLNIDDKVFKHTLSPGHLAKTYPRDQAARNVRYNSPIGLGADPATWRLNVTTADNRKLSITLDDLKALPKTDFAFEFKCIEGWSQVSWWGGVRFSDFIQHYNLQRETAFDYVGLSTPDDRYYIGVDTPSMMHPQTILAYEMTGQPLPTRHGAPLRLIIPIKYGVKNLKCIGKMFFSNNRPRDYWFERGYDYYCGL